LKVANHGFNSYLSAAIVAMVNSRFLYVFFFFFCTVLQAQQEPFVLRKGQVNDSIELVPGKDPVRIYLPADYTDDRSWPLLLYFDFDTRARERMESWKEVLDQEGFMLIHLQAATDSTSVVNSVKSAVDVLKAANELFPLVPTMIYSLGTQSSSRMASTTPFLVEGVKGTIALGGPLAGVEFLRNQRGKHFIGAIGNNDFAYRQMKKDWENLKAGRSDAHLLTTEGKLADSTSLFLSRCLSIIRLNAMLGGTVQADSTLYTKMRAASEDRFRFWIGKRRLVLAKEEWDLQEDLLGMQSGMSWNRKLRDLGLLSDYRRENRRLGNLFYKEEVEWFRYWDYLQSDLEYLQLDNLGWWNYQIKELRNRAEGNSEADDRAFAARSLSYISALVDDQLMVLKDQSDTLTLTDRAPFESLLHMLRTLLEPDNFEPYLRVISLSAFQEDYGTALYYLDLVFQKGFRDKERLYSLEHTALFRLSPEYNELVAKYLDESRY
jgi:hypothetical protein